MQTVAIAGATGSIGQQTLDVIRAHPEQFRVVALSGHSNVKELSELSYEFQPEFVVAGTDADLNEVSFGNTEVEIGAEGLVKLASSADIVVNAVVGFAGLDITLAGLSAGKRVALANKESMVAAGSIVNELLTRGTGELIPVDSEHSAIFQALGRSTSPVKELLLTSSGGPFRATAKSALTHVSIEDALAHPKWNMGAKISIDSSTMMNKALEVIEAHELFGVSYDQIRVVVHPEAVMHSAVTFSDGSTIAQLSNPAMTLPIAVALFYPERATTDFASFDWSATSTLHFEAPDLERFPALGLGYEAGRRGGLVPAALNAANEVAVAAFLDDSIAWLEIFEVVRETIESTPDGQIHTAEDVRNADTDARRRAQAIVMRKRR